MPKMTGADVERIKEQSGQPKVWRTRAPTEMKMTNEVNTARLVRVTATVPEICMHNVKLGPGCFCPHCPTASIDDLRGATEPKVPLFTPLERINGMAMAGEITQEEAAQMRAALNRGDKP